MNTNMHTIIWERKDQNNHTIENLQFLSTAHEKQVNSFVSGMLDKQPVLIEYSITLNETWHVKNIEIKSLHRESSSAILFLQSDGQGKWINDDDQEVKALSGCIDVAISITPFTNTIPIKRLTHSLENRMKLEVVYFDLSAWDFKKVEQHYTRIDTHLYKYEGVSNGFEAIIPVDAQGFVVDYPDRFDRVYPK